jgi:signal transduction histidine kinase
VRFIESQGNAIKDHNGQTSKVVVVSRDITEHKENETVLRTALADLKKSHEELKGAQMQLVQSEKLEAVSTFAAGVSHEVKNPLQTIILGVDYLSKHPGQGPTSAIVLNDMAAAVHRADSIIRGLLEFSAGKKREIKDENLTQIVEQSLQSVDHELKIVPIALLKDLAPDLPAVKLDFRTMKHVFINLFIYCIRAMEKGGTLRVRTFSLQIKEAYLLQGRVSKHLKIGDTVVVAEVEDTAPPRDDTVASPAASGKSSTLGLSVLKKIVELYGGLIDFHTGHGHKYTISFKAN